MNQYYMQRTVMKPVSFSGIGIHSGRETNITIKPAVENHGIKFRRIDLPGTNDIQAIFSLIIDDSLATVIGNNGIIVSTIEHLMATFSGLGIDNALVETDNYEMPIMDGSAKDFVLLISKAGIIEQKLPKQFFIVKKTVKFSDSNKYVAVYPDECLKITCTIDFDHPIIGRQTISFDYHNDNFAKDISPARTFGFIKEVEYFKKYGFARGGSLKNSVVVGKDKVLNEDGLRFPDEFVRHKLLDSIGDFALIGMPIKGHIETYKSGHKMNNLFIKSFLQKKDAWKTGPVKIINN